MAEPMTRFPTAFGNLLCCADMEVSGAVEVALVGEPLSPGFKALERTVAGRYVPALVLAGGSAREQPAVRLLDDRPEIESRPTAYVCRGYVCDRPVTDAGELSEQLENAARAAATTTA
jgi:uncharacterized protein YyaL (SSP411 family)